MRPDLRRTVEAHTRWARPPLVSEVELRLITPECPLWVGTEEDAEQAGLPSPFWAFAWPGGQALARFVLDRPEWVRGKHVLDVGSGSAVEAIAALQAGAASVTAVDTDPAAAVAAALNAARNDVPLQTSTEDLIGRTVDADVVLLGDMTYDREMAVRVDAWARTLNAVVLVADPRRGFLSPQSWRRLHTLDAPADVDHAGLHLVATDIVTPMRSPDAPPRG